VAGDVDGDGAADFLIEVVTNHVLGTVISQQDIIL
jgi:hypothetical protein